MSTLVQQLSVQSYDDRSDSMSSSVNVDKVVQSVTNATKRLSQISTNTNNSAKKRKTQNKIGPWKLGRTLGRGSTGRVRLAKNIVTSKLAAVKIVPKSNFKMLENPKYKHPPTSNNKDRLPYGIEREIIIMKLISHPNIMGLYDVWENKNDLYLILEYIEGGELFDYLIKRGRLQEFEAVNYFKQIISGINYLHQFNICHRDLKPENLLLDHNKNIKIADFGMAALEVREKLLETSCGSPHYASPEIVAGKNYHGAPSDIWSCGIILFALLTGHLPFDDENIRKLLLKVQSGKFIMPPDLSWEAKDLISKMLKVDPDDRITIDLILTHPLYTKYPEPSTTASNSALNFQNFNVKPIESVDKIDKEILKNLSVLFHNCEEQQIIAKLTSSAKCSEKMFYYLLMKYRNEHIACNSFEDEKNQYNEDVDDPKPSIPRSTSIVKTTIYDQATGEKHTTIKKVPKSSSNYSNKSLKRVQQSSKLGSNSNFKVLSNITNTVSPNTSVRNFKASTSFNRKKTLLNTQAMSRNNSATNSLKARHEKSSKTSTHSKTKARHDKSRVSSKDTSMSSDTSRTQKSKPPQQKPPKLKSTGLLDLGELEQVTDKSKSTSKANHSNSKSTSSATASMANASTSTKASVSSSSALARKKNMTGTFGNKSLLNFQLICDEMFNEEESKDQQAQSRQVSAPAPALSHDKKQTLAHKERELAAKVHAMNDDRERKYKEAELRKKLEQQEFERKKLENEKRKQKERALKQEMDDERKRQSVILQEKQRQALEKLSNHKSTNDFADHFVSPRSQRYVTEPARQSSLDPRHARNVNSLLRAKSLAAPSPYNSSRNENTSKVLHKLGIDVLPQSPRRLDSSLKTSSSKNLSGYLKGSSYTIQQSIQEYEHEEIEISEVMDEDYDDNKENDMSLESFNHKEREKTRNALGPSSLNTNYSQKTTANSSPTIPYRSLLRDINETGRTSELNKSNIADDTTSMTFETIPRNELIPNPRFSRFSFGGILSNKETNEIGDITILNNTLNYSNTVVRKPKKNDILAKKNAEFDSKYSKAKPGSGMLRKSSTTNLLGLGIKQGRQQSNQFLSVDVADSGDEFNATLPSEAISIRESDLEEDEEEEEEDAENEFDDFGENDSDETMLDETELSIHRDQKSVNANATTIMDEDYSNFDIISSRTADVGKFNTMRPSIVESKETLILPPSPVEEEGPETSNRNSSNNDSIKSMYNNYEKLHGDKRISSNLIEMNKPDLKPDQHAYYRLSTNSQDKEPEFDVRNGLQRESINANPKKTKEDYNMSKNFEILDTSSILEEAAAAAAAAEEKSRKSQIFSSRTLSKVHKSDSIHDNMKAEENEPKSSIRRKMSLKPKREAPKVPGVSADSKRLSHVSMNESTAPKKNNWFKKIINAITSSPSTKSKAKFDQEEVATSTLNNKSFNIIDSSLTSVELTRVIKTHLELKMLEGSISHVDMDEEFGLITGIIPARYSHGRKLKFKIEIIDLINTSSLHLIKVKGNEKGFKNLANIVTFVVRQEEQATGRRRSSGYKFSGYKTKA